ncbi:MAG: hypothetical protein EBU88_12985, partial [Acidobacteria bacterium]|nr:hypothetical protein [Acidobacteriota bacterium]
ADPEFASGAIDTDYINRLTTRHQPPPTAATEQVESNPLDHEELAAAIVSALNYLESSRPATGPRRQRPANPGRWKSDHRHSMFER